ncbi:MAG: hypothetical protein Q9M48_00555 [Rhodobacterales bacterium]|nr:hypothetical protein [Rhodobacterales bacterium]
MRQLGRVSSVKYQETLWSGLFPGNVLTMQCLQQAVSNVESSFELAEQQRKRTLYRLDGGSGTDENLRWLLNKGYQILAKGFSGKRAHALADQVSRWDIFDDQSWLGWVEPTFDLGRSIQVVVRRKLHKGHFKHSYYVATPTFSSKRALMIHYNQRGGAEIEQFRNDKSGLHLSARRKQSFQAQLALVLLTDLTHNLLADFRHRGLAGSRFSEWGSKRIVRDLLAIPGRLHYQSGELKRIELLYSHQYADELIICLERYCSGQFDNRNGLYLHELCQPE